MTNELLEIPVGLIDRDPEQPRTHFNRAALEELAESVKLHGVIQPIEVEATADGRYRIHHGERRWRASKLAGRDTIPAVVAPPRTGGDALLRALLENLHREDLNAIEEARVFKRLIDELGWSRTRLAHETGRSLPYVNARLAWLALEPEIQDLVAAGHLHIDGRLADKLRLLTPEVRVPLAQKLAQRTVGLKGALAACDRAAEEIATRAQAVERGNQAHAELAARIAGPNGHGKGRANGGGNKYRSPMLAHGLNGSHGLNGNGANGSGPPSGSIEAAASAMCRECHIRPRGAVIPAWEIVEREAAATCAACEKRDGPAVPEVCKNCPGVALVRRLVAGVEDGRGA